MGKCRLVCSCNLNVNVGLPVYCEIPDMTSHPADISTTQGVSFHTAVPNEVDGLIHVCVRGWSRVQLWKGEMC